MGYHFHLTRTICLDFFVVRHPFPFRSALYTPAEGYSTAQLLSQSRWQRAVMSPGSARVFAQPSRSLKFLSAVRPLPISILCNQCQWTTGIRYLSLACMKCRPKYTRPALDSYVIQDHTYIEHASGICLLTIGSLFPLNSKIPMNLVAPLLEEG